ncbi:hypothetical protein AB1N83_013465 [Pleurotus pulmonarius]
MHGRVSRRDDITRTQDTAPEPAQTLSASHAAQDYANCARCQVGAELGTAASLGWRRGSPQPVNDVKQQRRRYGAQCIGESAYPRLRQNGECGGETSCDTGTASTDEGSSRGAGEGASQLKQDFGRRLCAWTPKRTCYPMGTTCSGRADMRVERSVRACRVRCKSSRARVLVPGQAARGRRTDQAPGFANSPPHTSPPRRAPRLARPQGIGTTWKWPEANGQQRGSRTRLSRCDTIDDDDNGHWDSMAATGGGGEGAPGEA